MKYPYNQPLKAFYILYIQVKVSRKKLKYSKDEE